MSIDSARVLRDLVDEGVENLVVGCQKCDRVGRYAVECLVLHGTLDSEVTSGICTFASGQT